MNQLQNVFNYNNNQVRTVIRDGNPWFIVKDVCEILDIKNHNDVLSRMSISQKGVATTDTLGGRQEVAIVNEPGLYKLIFTSRKEEAEIFQEWVYSEVLPSIRKTGQYGSSLDNEIQQIINSTVDHKSKRKLITSIVNEYKQNQLNQIVIPLIPKPEHIHEFIDECCDIDQDSITEQSELYRVYVCWCIAKNEDPYNKLIFTRKIESFSDAIYLPADHKNRLNRRFQGIAVYE